MDCSSMVFCRFPSICRAASSRRNFFKCPQNISPFKFVRQKISIPLLGGNNAGLFSLTPIAKRGYVKLSVSASSDANKGGEMEEEKGKEMQPKWISSKLVKRDSNAVNLGQKLEVIKHLVAENIDDEKLLEALTYSAIYLKWITTGRIPWSEDSEPNKYDISKDIFSHLERIYSREDVSVEEILVIRKIHRCLPSLKDEFTDCVPIQRIGEGINDGRSLQEQLESIRDSLDHSSMPQFFESKQKLDDIEGILKIEKREWMMKLMDVLQALDKLRQEFVEGLQNQLQNDSFGAEIMRQQLRLSEIGLEDYASLLLSSFLDSLEDAGGAHWLAKNADQKNIGMWNQPLGALIIGIRQLGLSGWKPEECRAITSELRAWREIPLQETEGGEDGKRIWGLRLKATLDRAERLVDDYSEILLNIYPEKVEILGKDLEILDERYTEAEIHAGVVFQVSNLCTLLLKAVRKVVGAPGWDVLAPGAGFGELIQVESIGSIPSSETMSLIVVVNRAGEDEEVAAAEAKIGGVILLQGLPRLSHIVLTARKKKNVVVACEDEEECFKIRSLSGGVVNLAATFSNGVSLKPPEPSRSTPDFSTLPRNLSHADSTESSPRVKASKTYKGLAKKVGAVRVEAAEELAKEVGTENMFGPKAASCSRLASLAAEFSHVGVPALFKVPKAAVIPFGSIQEAVDRGGPAVSSYYWSLVKTLERETSQDQIRLLREKLREFVSRLSPSERVMKELSEIFPRNTQLILRSSPSVEDLRGMEEDSIPIFTARMSNVDLLRDAIGGVWASLYTPAAFRSRRAAQAGESDVDMAVLVQEFLSPELSFVLHIASASDDGEEEVESVAEETDDLAADVNIEAGEEEKKDRIEAEIAPGLGKTLAVDARASPWRLSYGKTDGKVETAAFANYSEELVVVAGDGGGVLKLTVDYSKKRLTVDPLFRQQLGRRLGAVGLFLAEKLRGRRRWDVEGCLVGDDIYIVQMRRRHGL